MADIKKVKVNFSAAELETAVEQIPQMQTEIAKKVDAVPGKGLSENDYTDAEKEKLSGLENYDDTEVQASIQSNTTAVSTIYNNNYNRGVNISAVEGWWRIASIDTAGYVSGADVVLYRNYNNARPELVHFQILDSSYGSDFRFLGRIGSPQFFSKIRLVKGAPSQPAYLEVYYTSSNRNNIFAQVIPYSLFTNSRLWKPTTDVEQATGGIPDGYTATEFSLTESAASVAASSLMSVPMSEATKANLFVGLTDDYKEETENV